MKTLFCSLLLLSFFCVAESYAQKNYKKGYVVLTAGDTLQGAIDYRNWNSFFDKISFYSNKKETDYKVTDLMAFYIQEVNENYRSFTGRIDSTRGLNMKFAGLGTFLKSPSRTSLVSIFVRELIGTNQFSIFITNDAKGRVHFFAKKDSIAIQPLIFHEFVLSESSSLYPVKLYQQQLFSLMGDCENIAVKLNDLAYTESGMRKIFFAYSQCKNYTGVVRERQQTQEEKERKKPIFGIVGGLALNSFKFTSSPQARNSPQNYDYPLSLMPNLGVFFELPLGRNLQRVAFTNQLMFFAFNAKVEKLDPNSLIIDRKGSYIRNNLLLKYKILPLKKINPFFQGGFSLGYQLLPKELSTERNKKLSMAFIFGLGLAAKKSSISITYDFNGVTKDYSYFGESLNTLSFNISYNLVALKKK